MAKLSVKENFFETIKKGGKPDSLVVQWGPMIADIPNMKEPALDFVLAGRAPGVNTTDAWGVPFIWPEGQPGGMPHITEENKIVKDITRWRDTVKVPDIDAVRNDTAGWEAAHAHAKKLRDEGNMFVSIMPAGLFEQMHFLMGFEDALISMLTEPEAAHELLDCLTEYRVKYAQIIIDKMKPDAVMPHDDWGAKTSLFMSPDTWREFFKERCRRIYKPFNDAGILVVHHADSFCEPIVEDMAEIGIDVWQGVLPQNDIKKMQKALDGRMALMGGIDTGLVDVEDVPEEVIRNEVRKACAEYVPGGNFIVNLPTGLRNGAIYPRTDKIIDDEIMKCNAKMFG